MVVKTATESKRRDYVMGGRLKVPNPCLREGKRNHMAWVREKRGDEEENFKKKK